MKKNFKNSRIKQLNILEAKNIDASLLKNKGEELRKQWEVTFAKNITRAEKKEYDIARMLWHVFSYDMIDCLEKDEAVKAFNQQKKKSCYLFYQQEEDAFILEEALNLKAGDIINKIKGDVDVYITSTDFKWTYVVTHEKEFGPYFHFL